MARKNLKNEILQLLELNARMSLSDISKKLDVPVTTVHDNLKKLLANNDYAFVTANKEDVEFLHYLPYIRYLEPLNVGDRTIKELVSTWLDMKKEKLTLTKL